MSVCHICQVFKWSFIIFINLQNVRCMCTPELCFGVSLLPLSAAGPVYKYRATSNKV